MGGFFGGGPKVQKPDPVPQTPVESAEEREEERRRRLREAGRSRQATIFAGRLTPEGQETGAASRALLS